jgi:hypothetical protein
MAAHVVPSQVIGSTLLNLSVGCELAVSPCKGKGDRLPTSRDVSPVRDVVENEVAVSIDVCGCLAAMLSGSLSGVQRSRLLKRSPTPR